jgi:hypothetical protein
MINDGSALEAFEIEVRNRKDVAATVHVLERHWGDWNVTEKNTDFVKADANTMDFTVNLKAGETKTIKYTVVTKW